MVRPAGWACHDRRFPGLRAGVIVTNGSEKGFERSVEQVVHAVADGTVAVPVDKTFPLAEAAGAHRLSEQGDVRGKIVLTIE